MALATEVTQSSALELARLIAAGEVSSREVVDAHLERIDAINPTINAIRVTLADGARAAADAADVARAAGAPLGPLHGVPFTVKENVDVLDGATTWGLAAMAEAAASVDAPSVAGLRAAGAIPLARTNLPDMGLRWHTHNALAGDTRNPWDLARTPGGSSGGEAAALATGLTPLGVGNDLGGSLRWPSQCCGTAALKPSFGRVAHAQDAEPRDAMLSIQLMAVNGPMARRVADLRAALAAMIAPDPRDPWHTAAPLAGPDAPRRVLVVVDPGEGGVDPDVAAGVRRAADALARAGYDVAEGQPPALAEAVDAFRTLVFGDVERMLPLIEPLLGEQALAFLRGALASAPPAAPDAWPLAWLARSTIARAWSAAQAQRPLILGPVATMQPFAIGWDVEHGLEALHALRLVVAVNLLGLPAAAVPVGLGAASGLPQGVQLIGPRFREDLCLDAAQAIEDALGTLTPIDPRG
jgi:amidase